MLSISYHILNYAHIRILNYQLCIYFLKIYKPITLDHARLNQKEFNETMSTVAPNNIFGGLEDLVFNHVYLVGTFYAGFSFDISLEQW